MIQKKTIRILLSLLALVVCVFVLTYFKAFNPSTTSAPFLQCPIYKNTGLQCVSCGGQRALHDLLNFRFYDALLHNAFLVVGLPLWIYLIIRIIKEYVLGYKLKPSFIDQPKFVYVFIAICILFILGRNIFPIV